MKQKSYRHARVPSAAPITLALAQAGLLVAVMSPPALAAVRPVFDQPARFADAPMLYLAQSTADYGKIPGAKPPPAPAPKVYGAPPAKGVPNAGDSSNSGSASVPQAKPVPAPDPRNSTR